MNEFDLLRKKTGMTIAKAWMLMVSVVVIFALSNGIFNMFFNANRGSFTMTSKEFIVYFTAFNLSIFLGCLCGIFINKKQLPSFRNTTPSNYIWGFVIAMAWCYINPVILDFFPSNPISLKDNKLLLLLGGVGMLLTITLQIGIIGHGLLRNYSFKNALFTVIAVSIIMLEPQSVIILVFYTLFLYYIYYRTASFQLIVFITTISVTTESFLPLYFDADYSINYVRTYFLQNETLYYIGFVFCVGLIITGLYYIKTHTKFIEWQRPDEDENITFL